MSDLMQRRRLRGRRSAVVNPIDCNLSLVNTGARKIIRGRRNADEERETSSN